MRMQAWRRTVQTRLPQHDLDMEGSTTRSRDSPVRVARSKRVDYSDAIKSHPLIISDHSSIDTYAASYLLPRHFYQSAGDMPEVKP
jgi:hypothetical protein